MSDPRLCSVHLEALPRRDEFRRAREALIGSCGEQTLAVDQAHLDDVQLRTDADEPESVPVQGRYWLVDQDGVHSLKLGLNTVGRMPDNDIAVADGSVSRRHCAIVVHTTRGCELFDTASKNGTYVNDQRISGPTWLKAGDKIRLCERQLVFFSGDQPGAADDDPNGRTHFEG
jgi:pSer/pThr/pTyr-binding forkhead associated (FHA) protein